MVPGHPVPVQKGQSNGVTPLPVATGEYVEVTVQFAPTASTPDVCGATLQISGDTWNPVSIPITAAVTEITVSVPLIRVMQGNSVSAEVEVTLVRGNATTANLYLGRDASSKAANVTASLSSSSLSLVKGQPKPVTLTVSASSNLPAGPYYWGLGVWAYNNAYSFGVSFTIRVRSPDLMYAVLVVGDGDFIENGKLGINFAPTQDLSDDTFTLSEFVFLLRNNPQMRISVATAHRHNDPNATYPNFNFAPPDRALQLDLSQYDVIWMFGYEGNNDNDPLYDYGSPISPDEVAAITKFMDSGGGVFATGDHSGLGSFMCGTIPRVASMRKWYGEKSAPIPPGYQTNAINYKGQQVSAINWGGGRQSVPRADTLQKNPNGPNGDTDSEFHFDDQSDKFPQLLSPNGPLHPILQGGSAPLWRFPDHMHEGEVVTPASLNQVLTINGNPYTEFPTVGGNQPAPAVIATGSVVGGHSTIVFGPLMGCEQNNFGSVMVETVANTIGILCIYDGRRAGVGRIVTDSSFHHYVDVNLIGDPCGSSPDRKQGFGLAYVPPTPGGVLADLQTFYTNTVIWLAPE
jgi:hypothetical protein